MAARTNYTSKLRVERIGQQLARFFSSLRSPVPKRAIHSDLRRSQLLFQNEFALEVHPRRKARSKGIAGDSESNSPIFDSAPEHYVARRLDANRLICYAFD